MKSGGMNPGGSAIAPYKSAEWCLMADIAVSHYLTPLTKVADLRSDLAELIESIRQSITKDYRGSPNQFEPMIDIVCKVISRLVDDYRCDHHDLHQLYQSVCHLGAALYLANPFVVVVILRSFGSIIPEIANNAYLHEILKSDFDTRSVIASALTVGSFLVVSEMTSRGLAHSPDCISQGSSLGEEYAMCQCLGLGKPFDHVEDQHIGQIVAKCCELIPMFVMEFVSGVRKAYLGMVSGMQYSLGEGKSGDLLRHVLMKSLSRAPTPALLLFVLPNLR